MYSRKKKDAKKDAIFWTISFFIDKGTRGAWMRFYSLRVFRRFLFDERDGRKSPWLSNR